MSSKTIKNLIIICLIIIIGIILSIILLKNWDFQKESQNNIEFKNINYMSVDNVIFYSDSLNLDEETKMNFKLISKEFKKSYPNKQILYLRNLGNIDEEKVYRFIQISNNVIIDDAELNIYFNNDDGIKYIIGVSNNNGGMNRVNWKNIKDNTFKIDEDKIKSIAQQYILKEYNISSDLTCETELRYYKSKICWKITFYYGMYENEIFIDANSGDYVDTIKRQTILY